MTNWETRAKSYNNLEWACKDIPLLLAACKLDRYDIVLDAGCGTGIVSSKIHKLADYVIGLDSCLAMLKQIPSGIPRHQADIKHLPYQDETFSKIIVRMVLHHLVEQDELESALQEFYRVLKIGGLVIVQEGVPPRPSLAGEYTKIFKLKEHRRTFSQMGLMNYLKSACFVDVKSQVYIDEGMSIRNWLDNDDTLSNKTKKRIFKMHKYSSSLFKEAYNLRHRNGDILIDTRIALVTGTKLW